ncbi:hypothetical protein FBU59_001580 [Linderina macrospora]|uniref:Uncharacterized protein n=1 Tax=Linderina macrospora TaxID=4868 RepID=A0ACC1JDQ2_9FUNG|nr:hypothetical protein FBU59_001580 [Linderina macrospora]
MRLSLDPPHVDDVSDEPKGLLGPDTPSLELLAEMIKEEIRQASGLKQALDKVGTEMGGMEERVLQLPASDTQSAPLTPEKRATKQQPKKQVRFTVPDDVRFRWLGIFQAPDPTDGTTRDSDQQGQTEERLTTPEESTQGSTQSNGELKQTANSETAVPETRGDSQEVRDEADTNKQAGDPPHRIRRVSALPATTVRETRRQDTGKATTAQESGGEQARQEDGRRHPFASNSSIEAVYGGSRPDTRESAVVAEEQSLYKDAASALFGGSGKFATVSGRNSRKISAHLFGEQPSAAAAATDKSSAPPVPSLPAQTGPQAAESRVHIPKRYSVLSTQKNTDPHVHSPQIN